MHVLRPQVRSLTCLNSGLLHVSRASVLKHVLRSMLRMMQASGTAEGMRTLIDSSLLQSAETVIEYRGVFGPTVLPIGEMIFLLFRRDVKMPNNNYPHSD